MFHSYEGSLLAFSFLNIHRSWYHNFSLRNIIRVLKKLFCWFWVFVWDFILIPTSNNIFHTLKLCGWTNNHKSDFNMAACSTNKFYSLIIKLHNTAASIRFIKKALFAHVIPKFRQIKWQYLNDGEKHRAE